MKNSEIILKSSFLLLMDHCLCAIAIHAGLDHNSDGALENGPEILRAGFRDHPVLLPICQPDHLRHDRFQIEVAGRPIDRQHVRAERLLNSF